MSEKVKRSETFKRFLQYQHSQNLDRKQIFTHYRDEKESLDGKPHKYIISRILESGLKKKNLSFQIEQDGVMIHNPKKRIEDFNTLIVRLGEMLAVSKLAVLQQMVSWDGYFDSLKMSDRSKAPELEQLYMWFWTIQHYALVSQHDIIEIMGRKFPKYKIKTHYRMFQENIKNGIIVKRSDILTPLKRQAQNDVYELMSEDFLEENTEKSKELEFFCNQYLTMKLNKNIQEYFPKTTLPTSFASERAFMRDAEQISDLIKKKMPVGILSPTLTYSVHPKSRETKHIIYKENGDALQFILNQIKIYEQSNERITLRSKADVENTEQENPFISSLWLIEAPIGMGKTIFMNRLFLDLVDQYLSHSLVVPILIEGNQIRNGSWEEFLTARYQNHLSFIQNQRNRCSEKKGKMVVLLDGMDEITPQTVVNQIIDRVEELGGTNVFVVISSRTDQVNRITKISSITKASIKYPKDILLQSLGFKEQISPPYQEILLKSMFKLDQIPGIFLSPLFVKILSNSWNIKDTYKEGKFSFPIELSLISEMYYGHLIKHGKEKNLERDIILSDVLNDAINLAIEIEYEHLELHNPAKVAFLRDVGIVYADIEHPRFIHEFFRLDLLARSIVDGNESMTADRIFQLALRENQNRAIPSIIEYALEMAIEKKTINNPQFDIFEKLYEDNGGFFTRVKNKVLLARKKAPSTLVEELFEQIKENHQKFERTKDEIENHRYYERLSFYLERLNTIQFTNQTLTELFNKFGIEDTVLRFVKEHLNEKSDLREYTEYTSDDLIVNVNEFKRIFLSETPHTFMIQKYSTSPMNPFMLYFFQHISKSFTKIVVERISHNLIKELQLLYNKAQESSEEHLIPSSRYLENHPELSKNLTLFYRVLQSIGTYCRAFLNLEDFLIRIVDMPYIVERLLERLQHYSYPFKKIHRWRRHSLQILLKSLILGDNYSSHRDIIFGTINHYRQYDHSDSKMKYPLLEDLCKNKKISLNLYNQILTALPSELEEKDGGSWSLAILGILVKVETFLLHVVNTEKDGEILAYIYDLVSGDGVENVPFFITEKFGKQISKYYLNHMEKYSEMFINKRFVPQFNPLVLQIYDTPRLSIHKQFDNFPVYFSFKIYNRIPNLLEIFNEYNHFRHNIYFSNRVKNQILKEILIRVQNPGNETYQDYWWILSRIYPNDDINETYLRRFLKFVNNFPKEFKTLLESLDETESLLDEVEGYFHNYESFLKLEEVFQRIIDNELSKIRHLIDTLIQVICELSSKKTLLDEKIPSREMKTWFETILQAETYKTRFQEIEYYIEKLARSISQEPGALAIWIVEFQDIISFSNFTSLLTCFPLNETSKRSRYNLEVLVEFYIPFLTKFDISYDFLLKLASEDIVYAWYLLDIPELWQHQNSSKLYSSIFRKYPILTISKFPFNKSHFNASSSIMSYIEIFCNNLSNIKSLMLKNLENSGTWQIQRDLSLLPFEIREFLFSHEEFFPILMDLCNWQLDYLYIIISPGSIPTKLKQRFFAYLVNAIPLPEERDNSEDLFYKFAGIVKILEIYYPEKSFSYLGITKYDKSADDIKNLREILEEDFELQ